MNRAELIEAIADRLEQSRKEAADTLEAVLDEIKKAVANGEKVSLPHFGSIEAIMRNARTARNPRTNEPVEVKATQVPKFRPSAEFKALVSGARKAVADKAGPARKTAKKATGSAKKATDTAKKTAAKKTTSAAKKSSATAKKATTTAKKAATTAKKSATTATKTPAKKAPAKKSATAKKAPAKKTTAKKTTAKKSSRS